MTTVISYTDGVREKELLRCHHQPHRLTRGGEHSRRVVEKQGRLTKRVDREERTLRTGVGEVITIGRCVGPRRHAIRAIYGAVPSCGCGGIHAWCCSCECDTVNVAKRDHQLAQSECQHGSVV